MIFSYFFGFHYLFQLYLLCTLLKKSLNLFEQYKNSIFISDLQHNVPYGQHGIPEVWW